MNILAKRHLAKRHGVEKLSPEKREWLQTLKKAGDTQGYYQQLGDNHSAVFLEAGPRLLVTFESSDQILNERENKRPLGFEVIDGTGCSHLCILAHSANWFRNQAIYSFFDDLLDEGFFDDFDQVVFYGAGMGGYAAAAFSVASPGSTVIAIQPQATLDPRVTEWDTRFLSMRRTCFTDRYGYAPDMLEACNRAFVLYDPEEEMDAMHAALFTRQNVSKIRCRLLGRYIENHLEEMDILSPLIQQALKGNLRENDIHRLYRARRNYPPYLRRLMAQLEDNDRLEMAQRLCKFVKSRMDGPCFEGTVKRVEQQLAQRIRRRQADREKYQK